MFIVYKKQKYLFVCGMGMQGYKQLCTDGKNNSTERFNLFIIWTLLKQTATPHSPEVSHCGSVQVQAANPTNPVWATPMQLLPHSGSTKIPRSSHKFAWKMSANTSCSCMWPKLPQFYTAKFSLDFQARYFPALPVLRIPTCCCAHNEHCVL